MNLYPNTFQKGDVVMTALGEARLLSELEGSDYAWTVHYLELDFEGEQVFEDIEHEVVEVVA